MATYVFVPGAWLGSWVWKKITPELRAKGHEVYTVTLTGMGDRSHLARREYGLDTAIKDVVNLIEYEDLTNVVLVGHSFAGKLISKVYDLIPHRIRLLIYLDAGTPKKTREPQGGQDPNEGEGKMLVETANADGEGWRLSIPDEWKEDLTFDLKGKDRDWFFSKITLWPLRYALDSVTLSERVDKVRKAYVFCHREENDFDENDLKYLDSLEGPKKYIIAGHYPMITKPEETIQALLEFAQ